MFQRNGNVKKPLFVICLVMLGSWLFEQVWLAVLAFFVTILILLIKMPLDHRKRPKDRITHFGPVHNDGPDGWYRKR